MNNEQLKLLADITCANIELSGMNSENKLREIQGFSPAYGEDAFMKLIDKYALDCNTVIIRLSDSCTAMSLKKEKGQIT